MAYGMPGCAQDGVAEIAFADQKQSISFYLLRSDVRTAFDQRLHGYDMGKGGLRAADPRRSTTTSSGTFSTAPPPSPARSADH